jgi:hypothetical protein
MLSFLLVLLVVLILIYLKYKNFPQKEGLGTQDKLPVSFSTFTLNNVPLQMIYWSNRLNGNATTGDIDPIAIADNLNAASKTMNKVLYGNEEGINSKYIGILSSIPFTINNLPLKMSIWAKRLKGDSNGGSTSPQAIANEIQYCSFLLSQALNGGSVLLYNNLNEEEQEYEEEGAPEYEEKGAPEYEEEEAPEYNEKGPEYKQKYTSSSKFYNSTTTLRPTTTTPPPTTPYEPPIDDLEDITNEIEITTPPPPTTPYEPPIDDLEDIDDELEAPISNEPRNLFDTQNSNKYIDKIVKILDNKLDVNDIKNVKKYAWLLESPEITPFAYDFIKNNYHKFDKVFTFEKDLLQISDKFILIPYGGCWINIEDRLIHDKSKNVSIILSAKKTTEGHQLRHEILTRFPSIHSFGFNNPIDNKIMALKDYRFSIVVENCKRDFYFSEKLIDCFMSGTIPIYWGCPSIGNFFDTDGIITFNRIDELTNIVNNLSETLYSDRMNIIIKNYELAKQFLVADDLIYKNLKND